MNKLFLEMAFDRRTFKDRLEEKITGALGEFYKAECAVANGYVRWTEHWYFETKQLLQQLRTLYFLHTIRGFKDRRKALDEVIAFEQSRDLEFKNWAESEVKKDFNNKDIKPLPPESFNKFYDLLNTFLVDPI